MRNLKNGSIWMVVLLATAAMVWWTGCDPVDQDSDVTVEEVWPDPDPIPDDPQPDDPQPDDPQPDDPLPDDPKPEDPVDAAGVFTNAVMSADGRFLFMQAPVEGAGICLAVVDLDQWSVDYPEGLCNLRWMAAAPAGTSAYLLVAEGNRLLVLRPEMGQIQAEYIVDDTYGTIHVAADGSALALSNVPVTNWSESQYEWNTYDMDLRHLAVISLETMAVHEQTFPYALRSVEFSPVDRSVLAVMSWWKADGLPEAQVHFMNPESGVVEDFLAFPNCADDLAIQPGGEKAILSPQQCFVHPISLTPDDPEPDEWTDPEEDWEMWDEWDEADPASFIDLKNREFIGNLPGFGPVQFSPEGDVAVAFSRQETLMKQWNIFQQELVGLILIRVSDLYWEVVEYGADEPDFFFPGQSMDLFLHDRQDGQDRLVRMDLESHEFTVLDGPPADFQQTALTSNSDVLYLVFEGQLHRHILSTNTLEPLAIPFQALQAFTRPDNDALIVTGANGVVYALHPDTAALLDSLPL